MWYPLLFSSVFTCCHFNHRKSLKIVLTLPKSVYIWIACLNGNLSPYPRAWCSLVLKKYNLFVLCLSSYFLLSFAFTLDPADVFFTLKFTDFISDSFQRICFALQSYVAYESWLQKLLLSAINNVMIYKFHKQYVLGLINFLLTHYYLRYSEYKHVNSEYKHVYVI